MRKYYRVTSLHLIFTSRLTEQDSLHLLLFLYELFFLLSP